MALLLQPLILTDLTWRLRSSAAELPGERRLIG